MSQVLPSASQPIQTETLPRSPSQPRKTALESAAMAWRRLRWQAGSLFFPVATSRALERLWFTPPRGKPSAEYLLERGFTNVKYIDHGFQGSGAKEGKKKGMRIVNGWQNDGLPWSMTLNADKIYRP